MLYLDYCATTPPRPEVTAAVMECMNVYYGNPSSLHRLGVEAEKLLIRAREVVAGVLSAKPQEVLFTSGGTESNNMAVKGAAMAFRSRGNHLITTAIEHPSVYEAFRQLEQEGFRVTYLPVDAAGAVRVEELSAALCKETILVSMMAVNNETGRIQPVEEAGRLLKQHPRIVFHVDAVQAFGKLPVAPAKWNADLVSFSAHKFRGPKGVGILYKREGLQLYPLLAGGGQEQGLRSGTENVPLIVGMAKAARLAVEGLAGKMAHMYGLRETLVHRLSALEGVVVHGSPRMEEMAPHVVQFSCPGYRPETLVHSLEEKEIYISTRSACSSGDNRPSRVLLAMGVPEAEAAAGLRISYSEGETIEDMERAAAELERVLRRLAPSSGLANAYDASFSGEKRLGGSKR
ncbi:MAG: aminotransferase [Paenibacillaceae bacterium]|jgi:cysteine desulfurase|nr:aminotransferase [Paenibacillaceae bacterium]